MVCISKSAIQCPSPTCNFAYFASSPDPAGKLRSHFNNLKARDAEHELFFQKPFCVFCGNVILSKTRKGLWKSDMNKHWLITHSTEFAELAEQHSRQEMEIALILSPSQLERLSKEWLLEYTLEEGDLIVRKGRETHLSCGISVARITSNSNSLPEPKRRRISYAQTISVASSAVESGQNCPAEEPDTTLTQSRGSIVEGQKTLHEHNGWSRENGNATGSHNIVTSGIAVDDTAKTALTRKQCILARDAITENHALPSTEFLTLQENLSDAGRDSGMGGIRPIAGQLITSPMGATDVDGMLPLESPMQDNFWYNFLDPLPVDVDLARRSILETHENCNG